MKLELRPLHVALGCAGLVLLSCFASVGLWVSYRAVVPASDQEKPGRTAADAQGSSAPEAPARLPAPEIDQRVLEAHLRVLREPAEETWSTPHLDAIKALGYMGPAAKAAIPELSEIVHSGLLKPPGKRRRPRGPADPATRGAVVALGRLGLEAYEPLRLALYDDAIGDYHGNILLALTQLVDLPAYGLAEAQNPDRIKLQAQLRRQYRPTLLALLLETAERPSLRQASATYLHRLDAFEEFIQLLSRSDPAVRAAACEGLYLPRGMFGATSPSKQRVLKARVAIPHLTQLLDDPDAATQAQALTSLERLRQLERHYGL
jgi:hypothetical protein